MARRLLTCLCQLPGLESNAFQGYRRMRCRPGSIDTLNGGGKLAVPTSGPIARTQRPTINNVSRQDSWIPNKRLAEAKVNSHRRVPCL